jgi:hypothetical protein
MTSNFEGFYYTKFDKMVKEEVTTKGVLKVKMSFHFIVSFLVKNHCKSLFNSLFID